MCIRAEWNQFIFLLLILFKFFLFSKTNGNFLENNKILLKQFMLNVQHWTYEGNLKNFHYFLFKRQNNDKLRYFESWNFILKSYFSIITLKWKNEFSNFVLQYCLDFDIWAQITLGIFHNFFLMKLNSFSKK